MKNNPPTQFNVVEPSVLSQQTTPPILARQARSPYKSPRLIYLGDVRDLTLGGSGDFPESGGNFIP